MKKNYLSIFLLFIIYPLVLAADKNDGATLNFKFKKLSEMNSERERYLYIYDMAEAGVFKKTTWDELKKYFDISVSEHVKDDKSGKTIIVRLKEQSPDRPRLSFDDVGARSYVGWYVLFEIANKGGIEKYNISNFHK